MLSASAIGAPQEEEEPENVRREEEVAREPLAVLASQAPAGRGRREWAPPPSSPPGSRVLIARHLTGRALGSFLKDAGALVGGEVLLELLVRALRDLGCVLAVEHTGLDGVGDHLPHLRREPRLAARVGRISSAKVCSAPAA